MSIAQQINWSGSQVSATPASVKAKVGLAALLVFGFWLALRRSEEPRTINNPQYPITKKVREHYEDYAHAPQKLIGWLEIPPLAFLRLTTPNMSFLKKIENKARDHIDLEEAEAYDHPPLIEIDPVGLVREHEGRHRTASAKKTGEPLQIVALLANQSEYEEAGIEGKNYWHEDHPVPEFLYGQFNHVIKVPTKGLRFKYRWDEPWITLGE